MVAYSIHFCDKNPNPSNLNVQKTKNIVHNMADSRLCVVKRVWPPTDLLTAHLRPLAAHGQTDVDITGYWRDRKSDAEFSVIFAIIFPLVRGRGKRVCRNHERKEVI